MSLCVVCVCVCGKEKEKLFFYLFFYFFLLLLSLPRYGQHVCQKLSLRERRQEISRLVKRGEKKRKRCTCTIDKNTFLFYQREVRRLQTRSVGSAGGRDCRTLDDGGHHDRRRDQIIAMIKSTCAFFLPSIWLCVCVCVPPRRIIFSCPVLDWVSLWGFLLRWAAVLRHP